jgi:hypothetical protein
MARSQIQPSIAGNTSQARRREAREIIAKNKPRFPEVRSHTARGVYPTALPPQIYIVTPIDAVKLRSVAPRAGCRCGGVLDQRHRACRIRSARRTVLSDIRCSQETPTCDVGEDTFRNRWFAIAFRSSQSAITANKKLRGRLQKGQTALPLFQRAARSKGNNQDTFIDRHSSGPRFTNPRSIENVERTESSGALNLTFAIQPRAIR